MFRPTYRARHRAAGALLGLGSVLPLANPATAAAAPTASVALGPSAMANPMAAAVAAPAVALPAAVGAPQTHDVVIHNPYSAKDRLAAGWTVLHAAGNDMKVVCSGPSVAGRTANTYTCLPAAAFAVACFAKTGYSDVVTCVTDPRHKRLVEYRTARPLVHTGVPAMAIRRPVAAVMSTGAYCRLTSTGVAVRQHESVISWGACEDGAGTRLWQNPDGTNQYRLSGGAVQYRAATQETGSPIRWTTVQVRYWIG